ncbi:hypothetical protein HDU87_003184 [Geranomyces variabilis]|uniref:SYO1-like TPR repeats domain-containing protein n=1 Tax=Geranomyces variabilis TaxID=109894 RepID=A0AAD5TKQ1_9FUNG|nr:hypothetical protein HDU87_003184 [Geranomyces variabilis]
MGKANNKGRAAARARRNDPTGLADLSGPVAAGIMPPQQQAPKPEVFPVVKKLSSDSIDDRAWAATALSNLVLDPEMRKKLLAAQVLPPLLALLADQHAEVVVEATGALRNLVVAGGQDACGDLVRTGTAVPALLALLERVSAWISARLADEKRVKSGEVVPPLGDKKDVANRAACFDVAEQLVAVLWSLAEAFDEAVRVITQSWTVFPFLMELLNPEHELPWKLVQIAGQCLNTLTDENPACYPIFTSRPEYADRFAAIASGAVSGYSTWDDNRMLLRPLCGNILYNIREALLDKSDFAGHVLFGSIFNSITAALDYDVAEALVAGAGIEADMERTASAVPPMDDGASVDIQSLVQRDSGRMAVLEGNLETVQLALELLANVVVVEEGDGWENLDVKDDREDDDDDEDEDDAAAMMEADAEIASTIKEESGNNAMGDDSQDDLLDPVLAMLADEFPTLFGKVLALINTAHITTTTTAAQQQAPPAELVAHLTIVQTRALACLTNVLATNVAPRILPAEGDADRLWHALFLILGPAQARGSMELVDAALGALLGVLRVAETNTPKNASASLIVNVPEDHIGALVNALVAGSSPTDPTANPTTSPSTHLPHATLSKLVTVLSYLAKRTTSIPVTAHIMTTLLALLTGTPPPPTPTNPTPTPHTAAVALATDILNAFYDVFADAATDPTDCVYVDGGMNEVLRAFVPGFRARCRQVDKRKNRDMRERAEEALLNLVAFVKYKDGERKAMKGGQ